MVLQDVNVRKKRLVDRIPCGREEQSKLKLRRRGGWGSDNCKER